MSQDLGRDVPDLEKLYARKLWADFSYPTLRDAEMTIKIIFERSSQKGGVGRGFEKRVDRGPILKFYCRAVAQEKQHFGKSHFYCRRFSPGNAVTIILGNYPPLHPPGGRIRGP